MLFCAGDAWLGGAGGGGRPERRHGPAGGGAGGRLALLRSRPHSTTAQTNPGAQADHRVKVDSEQKM